MNILRSLRALVGNRTTRRTGQSSPSVAAEDIERALFAGVRTYSQRLSPPFAGQVQIAESARARALTLDGSKWEIQFIHTSVVRDGPGSGRVERRFQHVHSVSHSALVRSAAEGTLNGQPLDERILELAQHISDAVLPFPANDHYEYWLLDAADGSPLAFIFSCADPNDIQRLPVRPEWTALPAAVMPIVKTEAEVASEAPPVNYRFERLVAERAGPNPKATWFRRGPGEPYEFPPLLVREDWQEEQATDLCQRYLQRQASRLLMLHGLTRADRLRMERAVRPNVMELARFHPLYPAIADEELMNAMRVEARLRDASGQQTS